MSVLTNPLVTAFLGAGLAAAVTVSATPVPSMNEDCKTYRVRQKAVTAFVLKPPPAPIPDPVVIKEKCEAPKVEESAVEEPRPTRRHHHKRWRHRVRAYWR